MLKTKNFVKHKLKKNKLRTLIRAVLIFTFLSLFYIRFLFWSTPSSGLNTLNENSFLTSFAGRKILSVDLNEQNNHWTKNCSKPAILEFPSDGFTFEQRQHGWIILHIVLMFYGLWFLATICDDYLVPSIQEICSNLNIDNDVIGATIMAAAVSSPELFMNFIGTFITKGDIGVGTIVGSAVFNVLAVPACCGLFVTSCLKLDWWPITRDCLMYLLAILGLVGILRDGQVWWYEALALILAYLGYMLIMYYNREISRQIKICLRKCGFCRPQYTEVTEFTALLAGKQNNSSNIRLVIDTYHNLEQSFHGSHIMLYLEQQEKEAPIASPWSCENQTLIEFFLRWPLTFLLWLTVPNCRRDNSLKYFTLFMSCLWIAVISYLMAFVITIIGDTLKVPDAAMGLTILASGMSIPEAVSSIVVTRQGQGGMGMSNSLGSNTFDILLSLGLPWFIKAFCFPEQSGQKLLHLDSTSLSYAGIMLLISLIVLYLLLVWNKFTLDKRMGFVCLFMYIGFIVTAVLIELNVFFPIKLPKCRH